jgi:hypothetical protein
MVGEPNGQKLFSQKLPRGNSPSVKQTILKKQQKITLLSPASSKILQQHKRIAKLKKLAPTLTPSLQKLSIKTTPIAKQQATDSITHRETQQLQRIRQATLQKMSPTIRNSPAIQKSGFFFKFVPPQGIPEDELNSIEKIFYSFQKRTYHSYITSLISTYYKMLTEKPYIEKNLFTKNERLSGRISIDIDGNITRVKFIQTSQSSDIQQLFENTLLGIRNLPNPPKELLQGGDELNIYFQLIIAN